MEQKKEERYVIKMHEINIFLIIGFCFERLKHVHRFNLKHSRTQELSYIGVARSKMSLLFIVK